MRKREKFEELPNLLFFGKTASNFHQQFQFFVYRYFYFLETKELFLLNKPNFASTILKSRQQLGLPGQGRGSILGKIYEIYEIIAVLIDNFFRNFGFQANFV